MILTASRRTDIPAFYSEWFMDRIEAGYCAVPNPFNPAKVSYVSLKSGDVDCFVFCTRHPARLIPHLEKLDGLGYRYYFQYTLMNNPRVLDQKGPSLETALRTFRRLSSQIGPERVIWRYDPIVFSEQTGASFHLETFQEIAENLRGFTCRSVISIVDHYRKIHPRLRQLSQQGFKVITYDGQPSESFDALMTGLVQIAQQNGMEIVSCAEEIELARYGIQPGKCVDDDLIRRIFGVNPSFLKNLSQRKMCGCVLSQDIGMYDACQFACQYCYATTSFERARRNYQHHNPHSPSLLGWSDASPPPPNPQLNLLNH